MSDTMLTVGGRDFLERYVHWLLAAIMMLAGILRAVHIGQASLWNDELFSRFYIETGLRFLWTQGFSLETTPPTYYTLLLGWMQLFGTSETAMRSLSLVASVATIPLVYLLAREFTGRPSALLAALLMTLFPMQIHFAQEARAYALMLLPVAVALIGMARFLREPRDKHLALYAVGAIIAIYTHTTAILLVLAFNLAFLTTLIGRRHTRVWSEFLHWTVVNALVALCCIPEALAMAREVHANRLSWMMPISRHDIANSLGVLVTGPAIYPQKLSIRLGFIFYVALAIAVCIARPDRRLITILVLVPALDFALILLAGIRQPILVPRILCWMGLPLSVLLACMLSSRLRITPVLGVLTAIILLIGLTFQLRQGPSVTEPWRLLLNRLQPELAQADIVVVGPWTEPEALVYYKQDIAKARHWTEYFPDTVENTVIARQVGVKDIGRAELLSEIRAGHRVLLIQRAFEYRYQKLLTGVILPQEQIEQDCDQAICMKALYWGAKPQAIK